MSRSLSIIVAVAENGIIGRRGQLPWRLSADLRRFKQLTMGHTLVMGRLTFESIGRPLPGRLSIVMSRDRSRSFQGCQVARSWEDVQALAPHDRDLFVIGGRQLFEMALPLADKLYWTSVHAMVEGDVTFPNIDWDRWKLQREERHEADEQNEFAYSFRDYER